MSTIRDIHNPWRDALLPAMFDGAPFHVEAGSQEGGRRIVVHEFPKRDAPYAEDMGRRATEFTVRGYCIQFMYDAALLPPASDSFAPTAPLFMRDYRISRDILQTRLDAGGEGVLQLPHMARSGSGAPLTITVCCTRYRMTEEERFGGYAVSDMSFVEFGAPASVPLASTAMQLIQQSNGTLAWVTNNITFGPPQPPP
jgi:hypothetical protein